MLANYRVLDCSNRLGWLTGRILADLGADVIKVEPPEKERSDPNWQAYNVNKRLLLLDLNKKEGRQLFDSIVKEVDFLIEDGPPSPADTSFFDPERLQALNSSLIHVSVTPFGASGPKSSWKATDLEIMAAGGAMSLAGEAEGQPTRITVPQSYSWAGAQAAVGALTALAHRTPTGKGQWVDVSAQASVITALAHAPVFWDMLGTEPTRGGAFITGRTVTGAQFRAFWPCLDGYLNFVLYGGAAGQRTNRQLLAWMKELHFDPGILETVDWLNFDLKLANQEEIHALEEPIGRFFLQISKSEFLEEASRREMLGYPVSTVADISKDPQLEARHFWQKVTNAQGEESRHCGSFAIINGKRPPLRFAPGVETNAQTLLREYSLRENVLHQLPGELKKSAGMGGTPQALSGLKVIEFGAYAAGPHVGKLLANYGATVIHVESRQRPDGFRLEYPPYKDNKPGINRSGCFAFFNDSKYGVTLNLKNGAGLELARRLVGWGDVVIENMRPGVMKRLGLGFEELNQPADGIVMLSTCNMGQTGPRAHTPGFGSQLSSLAGFCGLIGSPEGSPMLLYGPYIDFIASSMGAAAVLAAVDKKRRTGEGAWIDLSQYETGLHFMAGALLQYEQEGVVINRAENRDPSAVPHGAYLCLGKQWVALSCWSDEEFSRLAQLMEQPELSEDSRFHRQETRRANIEVLDQIIGNWSKNHQAQDIAEILQKAGLQAHLVNTISDLFKDPQLIHRRIWRRRHHGEIGDHAYCFPAFELPNTPGDITSAAPLLGGDNQTVFQEFLDLTKEEMEDYQKRQAFD